jgi:hypothetical protein
MKRFLLVPVCGLLLIVLACKTSPETTAEPKKTAEVKEEPAKIPEAGEKPVEIPKMGERTVEITPVEPLQRPVFQPAFYNLLVVDRGHSALNSDIGETDGIKMLYKFKHGNDGYLIAVYTSKESLDLPPMPDGSRIIAIWASKHKSEIRGYVHSPVFGNFVTHRQAIPEILRVLEDERVTVIPALLPDPNTGKFYRLQVGAFSLPETAGKVMQRLADEGFTADWEQYGSLYRVFAADIPAVDVYPAVQVLGAAGFREVWVRE